VRGVKPLSAQDHYARTLWREYEWCPKFAPRTPATVDDSSDRRKAGSWGTSWPTATIRSLAERRTPSPPAALPEHLDGDTAAQRPDQHEQQKLPELQIEAEQVCHPPVGSRVVADPSFIHLIFREGGIVVRARGFFVRARARFLFHVIVWHR
jgi:hypothetical protein